MVSTIAWSSLPLGFTTYLSSNLKNNKTKKSDCFFIDGYTLTDMQILLFSCIKNSFGALSDFNAILICFVLGLGKNSRE